MESVAPDRRRAVFGPRVHRARTRSRTRARRLRARGQRRAAQASCAIACDNYLACTEDEAYACEAECLGGLWVGVPVPACEAEYTGFVACMETAPCSYYTDEIGDPCTLEYNAFFECDLDHGISCGEGSNDIPWSFVCDGYVDCADGRDEADC